ncbi:aminoglycoside phosphotransferase family protein [Paenibacillus silvisoli]|uniref:aminoglycoside phosphotransferase family protein n=1 Tax=Paenibacillus silvisoli TaxID=3110539 RepID=UPI002804483F|nr:aminoglycoside phosphotransferase family protein [Paenibacillus silvisoli]
MHEHEALLNRIPLLSGSTKLERIDKGYSSDDKYMVYDGQGGRQYILRTYGIDQDEGKRVEFERLQMMEQHDVKCSKPIAIGVLPEQALGYMIVSYIEGDEASEALPYLTEQQQYSIGVQAGIELQKMHLVPCHDEEMRPWEERAAAKHQRYRNEYAACGIAINNDAKLLAFIDAHLPIMKGRPNLFQHDDYHLANMIVKDGMLSGIIDFNRADWGDPIHEFVKVGIFSSEVSVPFSIGQISAYNDQLEPSEEFWQLYSLYLAMTLISSVVWTLKVCPDQLSEMMQKIDKVMNDHDDFESIVPRWYKQYENASR